MRRNSFRQIWAVALAAMLVGWSFTVPRVHRPWRTPAQAGLAGLLIVLTRAPLGLRPPRLWRGLRVGVVAAISTATAVAMTTKLPLVRVGMAGRELPRPAPLWLLVQIPLGTVCAEEAAYRAALAAAGSAAFGPTGGRLLQASAFGLSHIADARATGEPVLPTVVATGVAGWVLGWLGERSGSLVAPMLAHLAINETGAAAALALQRR